MKKDIGARLLAFRHSTGMTQAKFAASLDVSAATISTVEKGAAAVSRKLIERLAERYSISADWLLHGTGDMFQATPEEQAVVVEALEQTRKVNHDLQDASRYTRLLFLEQDLTGESAAPPDRSFASYEVAFRLDWLRTLTPNPSHLKLTYMRDSGLTPEIFEGDLVMVDTSRTEIERLPSSSPSRAYRSVLFAVKQFDEVFIRDIEPTEDGGAKVFGGRRHHPRPEELTQDELQDLLVVGKVVWWSHAVRS